MSKIDKKRILRKDKIVLKNQKSERIEKIIFPHDIDFGIAGLAGLGRNIKFYNGLSGSLQKLADGSNYLVAGSGITVTNNDDGSITLTATAGEGTGDIQGVTAGNGLSGGGTAGTVSLALDLNELSAAAVDVANDSIVIIDANDSNSSKKESIVDLIAGTAGTGLVASSGVLSLDLNELTAGNINKADSIAFIDADDNSTKKESIGDFLTAIAGPGFDVSSNQLVPDLVEVGSAVVAVADDHMVILDSDNSFATKRESISDFIDRVASTGLAASSGQLAVSDLAVAQGGTGATSFADKAVIITQDSGTDALASVTMSTNGQLLIGGTSGPAVATLTAGSNISITNADGGVTIAASGVAPGAAGSDTQVQFNDGGSSLGGDSGLTFNKTTNTLTATNLTGSLSRLSTGKALLKSAGATTITTGSDGQITISSVNNQYGAGDGLDLINAGTTFALDLKEGGGLSIDVTELTIDNGVIATLTGSNFSGPTIHSAGLSGSLTQLADGTSYLVAGNNVTIVSESNGQITISAAAGEAGAGSPGGANTQVQFNDASSFGGDSGLVYNKTTNTLTSVNISGSLTNLSDGSSYLIAGSNISIVTQSNGSIIITGSASGGGTTTIGDAEDGTYTDGLFTDFLSTTEIGTAVDRFNEVLKSLAPSSAPALDDINSLKTGVTASLSFGASNDQSSATPAYVSVASSAGIAAAVDVNGAYAVVTSSNNLRLGVFDGNTHVTGVLNDDVISNSQGSNVQNYPAFSFGDGDVGVLRLNVNGSTLREIDLTSALIGSGTSGLGTGSYLDSNGSGFKFFSTPTTGTFSNGNAFNSFRHRTGQFVVASGSQRRGWNYARILHVKTGSTTNTNYVEWVNDDNGEALAAAGNSLSFEGSGSIHLSGVKYFRSGTATYKTRVTNAYKYVYDNQNILFNTSNSAFSSASPVFTINPIARPTIGGSENHTKVLHITGSGVVTANYLLSGSLTASVNVTHPIKTNLSAGGQSIETGILMFNLANTSTALSETFIREDFRVISGTYATQGSLIAGSNIWTSSVHISASNGGHSDGLQFFNSRLYSPKNTLRSGDFRDNSEGGTLNNSPIKNPNYSSLAGQRTFYRWFKNETGTDKHDLSITINGAGSTIVPFSTALNSSRIRVFIKFPSDGTRSTGWLDLASEFVLDSYTDNAGCHTANGSLSFDSSLNATNIVTLGTVAVGNNEYIGIRVEADATWAGYIDSITVSFGAGTGTISAVPDLDDIDCNDDGTDCNLSFGASKSISGYTNVGAGAGIGSAIDLNGLYQTDADSNNLRRSVFAKTTIIEGDLNEDVSANSPDYVANSFSDANSGSLKLEVNGSVLHTVEITGSFNLVGSGNPGSGTGIATGSNGSGFFDLSVWKPTEFDNEVPYYLEIYRTGKWRVATTDQRNGWNYARIIHSIPGESDRETNYVEWVNDSDSNALAVSGLTLQPFQDDNQFNLSGVKYFIQPSGSIEAKISNLYKNVYSNSSSGISFANLNNATGIRIIESGSGLTSTKTTTSSTAVLQTLNTTTNSQNLDIHATGSIRFSLTGSLSGSFSNYAKHSATGSLVFDHPLKTNLDTHNTLILTSSVLLVYSSSDTSNTNTLENFTGEQFRLQSGSYDSQSDVTSSTFNWSSSGSLNDNLNFSRYYTGLMLFDKKLISPLKGGNSGDFRNYSDSGVFDGPSSNVNYSSLGVSTREYYRAFLNPTSDDKANVRISLTGSNATIVGKGGALGTGNVNVEVRIPGKSGFMDLAHPSSGSGNTADGNGCLSGDLDNTIDSSGSGNICTFNGLTVDGTTSGQEYLVLKISADKSWIGNITGININWSTT